MQRFFDVVQDNLGRALGSIAVAVTDSGGNAAVLFQDNGITPATNPVYTNSLGEFSFYAANGTYTLSFSGGGITPETRAGVQLFDTTDLSKPRPTITGSRGGNRALTGLLFALDAAGLIIDATTP